MISLLFSLLLLDASAAEPVSFPWMAPVELPAEGVSRIRIPPELRTPADPADASDMMLVDGRGRRVPMARVVPADPVRINPSEGFTVRPTLDPNVWTIDVTGRPVDGLQVDLSGGLPTTVATVRVEHAEPPLDGEEIISGRVWQTPQGSSNTVLFPEPFMGSMRVSLDWHSPRSRGQLFFGLVEQGPRGEADRVTVPIPRAITQQNGWTWYPLHLPRPLPIHRIELDIEEPLIERRAGLEPLGEPQRPDEPPGRELAPIHVTDLYRFRHGPVQIEELSLPIPGTYTDRLAILVEDNGQEPLTIRHAHIYLSPAELIVQDPGPGPHILYAGAPSGTSTGYDLNRSRQALDQVAGRAIEVGEISENPDYLPPEQASGVASPGPVFMNRNIRWAREVSGESGLVRIPIPLEVFDHSRHDLGDLRLLDADSRQIPYILTRRSRDHRSEPLPIRRIERGDTSILTVPVEPAGAPIEAVTLRTAATHFGRNLTIARATSGGTQPLRSTHWRAGSQASALRVALNQIVGQTLIVEVYNGDDPPLPIDSIEISRPSWELWAVLPSDGARLVYGDRSLQAPRYDLALLKDDLATRITGEADVGPQQAASGPPISLRDRLLVLSGLGALALALLGLVVRLVVPARPGPTDPDPEPDEPAPEEPAG